MSPRKPRNAALRVAFPVPSGVAGAPPAYGVGGTPPGGPPGVAGAPPPHILSGGHPPVAPRGVGKAFRWDAIACASPPAEETGKAIVGAHFS